ncbi:MAG: DUF695 domain-containing protein [Bacteroidales bacterium]|jgi:hypothetical protein|nr:DUF695 domain-containing protein [Bacteroidales bacterium]MBO7378630.1 DUF695 domain-containing protein [Bacteroidales bacterium]MBP5214477.1 DUF695 domain-containing protein [Bacteroidales bacterium]
MQLTDNWFTALSENEDGTFTFISGRTGIDEFINSHKLRERIEVVWTYQADAKGLPADDAEAQRMEEVVDKLREVMEKDKLAIMTGVYTGQGQREINFICRNVAAFGERLNNTLSVYPKLPIVIHAYDDPDNEEYRDLLELKGEED